MRKLFTLPLILLSVLKVYVAAYLFSKSAFAQTIQRKHYFRECTRESTAEQSDKQQDMFKKHLAANL